MKFQIMAVITAAFVIGFAVGHTVGQSSAKVAAQPSIAAAPHSTPPHPLPPGTPSAPPTNDVDPAAMGGLAAMQQGNYAEAVRLLATAAKEHPETPLNIFHAIALEGAGESGKARSLLTTDSDIEQVRAIGRQAFMEQNDIFIAGPAYQLYLQLRPQTANREMMENAIRLWKGEETK